VQAESAFRQRREPLAKQREILAFSVETAKNHSAGVQTEQEDLSVREASSGAHWYVVYTRARHEKSVSAQLAQRAIENFLPLYEAVHRWKDRKARIHLPLFSGYVFVRIAVGSQLNVLQVPGVVRLVSFNGRPVAVPEAELAALKRGLASGVHVNPHPYLAVGKPVQITQGPFSGLKGTLVRKKGLCRVVVSFHLIKRSIALEVEAADVSST
jgi:transcription antitermination factor NusG